MNIKDIISFTAQGLSILVSLIVLSKFVIALNIKIKLMKVALFLEPYLVTTKDFLYNKRKYINFIIEFIGLIGFASCVALAVCVYLLNANWVGISFFLVAGLFIKSLYDSMKIYEAG